MGYFSEYISKNLSFEDVTKERKAILEKLQKRLSCDVLVYAADLNRANPAIAINYSDLVAVRDQLSNLKGSHLLLILETPGGSGEIAEDIVTLIRAQYKKLIVCVVGTAKSAGTIIAMAGDEIWMEPASSLGPIDAQLFQNNKQFSADALLEGMEKIKKEVEDTKLLNKAYIPILQTISPGELQNAENAQQFSKRLVTDWLIKYKFKDWTKHSTSGKQVTDEEKKQRAEEIATQLSNHKHWMTHGRSIKIQDLESMKLKIKDYSKDSKVVELFQRYYALMQISFGGQLFKLFETASSQIYRFEFPVGAPVAPVQGAIAEIAMLDVNCNSCKAKTKVQINLGTAKPLQAGAVPFPASGKLHCPICGSEIDLSDLRRQLEAQTGKKVVVT